MHRPHIIAIAVVFVFVAGLPGCAGKTVHGPMPATLATIDPAKGYNQKVAIVLTGTPATALGRRMGDLYLSTLIRTIRDKDHRVVLVTPGDEDYPAFLDRLAGPTEKPVDAFDLAAQGRSAGYVGLILARLRGIRPYAKKTGVLWFRKVRHFVSFDLTVDLYDPITAAKIVDRVEEVTVKISDTDSDAIRDDASSDIEPLSEEIVDHGEDLGESLADSLKAHFWRTSVVKVEAQRVYLPAGTDAGLAPGTRLAVFQGRRIIEGLDGERFIVPGTQTATIRISVADKHGAEAMNLDGGEIQVGDIAVPIK